MKHSILLLIVLFSFFSTESKAQIFGNDPEIKIDNLQPESVWQIAEMAMNENSIPIGKLNLAEGVLMSNWIEWTAIAIQNHAHLYLKYEAPTLTVKIADREYKSDKGYSEAIGNLSKKKYAEYVQSTADKITQISKDEALTRKAVKTSKLILAFNPIIEVEGLVFILQKTSKDENQHLNLEFTVHNETQMEIKVDIPLTGFHKTVNLKETGGRGNVKWSRPAEMGRNAVIQPDETLSLICDYADKWELNNLPQFDIRVNCKAGTKDLHYMNIYSIPFPYTYTEGD